MMDRLAFIRKLRPRLPLIGRLALLGAGIGLLAAGIVFLDPRGPVPPGPAGYRDQPRITPQATLFGTIPDLQADVTGLVFTAGRSSLEPAGLNGNRFPRAKTGRVYWQISLGFLPHEMTAGFGPDYIIYGPDGNIFSQARIESQRIASYSTYLKLSIGVGWDEPGHWLPGLYRLEIYAGGGLVATGAFEITP